MRVVRLTLVGAIALFGSVLAPVHVAAAVPLPAAFLTPCVAGTPISSDFDGDARADLVVSGRRGIGYASSIAHYIQPGDGSAPSWLVDTGELGSTDLNGDVCADAILFRGGEVPWLKVALGTPGGLDAANATELVIPQSADVGGGTLKGLSISAAGLRHDGISQVVVSGVLGALDGDDIEGFVDVLTLDAALAVTHTQVFTVAGAIDGFGQALATSGGTVAVGAPYARVRP